MNKDIQILSDTIWAHFNHPIPSVLSSRGIHTIGQMIKLEDRELMSIRNFGKTSMKKINDLREFVRKINEILNQNIQ